MCLKCNFEGRRTQNYFVIKKRDGQLTKQRDNHRGNNSILL